MFLLSLMSKGASRLLDPQLEGRKLFSSRAEQPLLLPRRGVVTRQWEVLHRFGFWLDVPSKQEDKPLWAPFNSSVTDLSVEGPS